MPAISNYFSAEQIKAFLEYGPIGFAAFMLLLAAGGMIGSPSNIKALLLGFFMIVGAFCFVIASWASTPVPGLTPDQVATLKNVLQVTETALEDVKNASKLGLAGCSGKRNGVPLFHASEFSNEIAEATGHLSQIRGQVQQALNGSPQ